MEFLYSIESIRSIRKDFYFPMVKGKKPSEIIYKMSWKKSRKIWDLLKSIFALPFHIAIDNQVQQYVRDMTGRYCKREPRKVFSL